MADATKPLQQPKPAPPRSPSLTSNARPPMAPRVAVSPPHAPPPAAGAPPPLPHPPPQSAYVGVSPQPIPATRQQSATEENDWETTQVRDGETTLVNDRSPKTAPAEAIPREEVARIARGVVEESLAGVRAWQREIESTLSTLERQIMELRAAAASPRMAAAPPPPLDSSPTATHPGITVSAAIAPPSPQPHARPVTLAGVGGIPATAAAPPLRANASQSIPVIVSDPPPAAAPPHIPRAPSYSADAATDALMRLASAPIDYGVLPGGLNGARRKRTVAWVVAILLLILVGSLVVAAVVSQTMRSQ